MQDAVNIMNTAEENIIDPVAIRHCPKLKIRTRQNQPTGLVNDLLPQFQILLFDPLCKAGRALEIFLLCQPASCNALSEEC